MVNAWEERIRRVIKKVIRTEYPYISKPSAVCCRVTNVREQGYSIVLLDENKNRDVTYPEIPNVQSQIELKKGDTVAVIFLGGQDAYIVGRI